MGGPTYLEFSVRTEPRPCPHFWSRGRNLDIRGLNTTVASEICSRRQTIKLQLRGDLFSGFSEDALAFITSADKTLEILHLNIVDAHEFMELDAFQHTDADANKDFDVDVTWEISEIADIHAMVVRKLVHPLGPTTRLLDVKVSGVTGWECRFMELLA